MITVGFHRASAVVPEARLVVMTVATVLVAACAPPGAVSTPSAATTPAASANSSAPSASAGPSCGTDPVKLNAYFETGFDLPFKLSEEFTKQFPNRSEEHTSELQSRGQLVC